MEFEDRCVAKKGYPKLRTALEMWEASPKVPKVPGFTLPEVP